MVLAAFLNSQFLQLGVWKAKSLFLVISFNYGLNKDFSQKEREYMRILKHFHDWKRKFLNLFRKQFLKKEVRGGEDFILSSLEGISPNLVAEEHHVLEI